MKNASVMRQMSETGPIPHISVLRVATLTNSLNLNRHSLATTADIFIRMSTVDTIDINDRFTHQPRISYTEPRRTP